MFLSRKISFAGGALCGLAFAPVFFAPGLFALSILLHQVKNSITKKQASCYGYIFGFGFYLSSLYWIAFGPAVFIEEFWWIIPFALVGLPLFLALFISLICYIAWHCKGNRYFHLWFCILWIIYEWLIFWAFTGLPWSLLGYSFSFSLKLIQFASITGVLGLSFVAVYIGSAFFCKPEITERVSISLLMLTLIYVFGHTRLENNPTQYHDIKVRIVQPSIKQTAKWDPIDFWRNLDKHIILSNQDIQSGKNPDIIIWSEAALTAPYWHPQINRKLQEAFKDKKQILIFGGISDNQNTEKFELYSSFVAINSDGKNLFEYHKSHLVPFGEYIPFGKYLPMQKITHGLVDYTPGKRRIISLDEYNLKIHPMICYESIFANEIRISNKQADLIINITNDAWYGKSSGPYQHFEITKMRAIENGLPLIRSANNGISGIMDSYGRSLQTLKLNKIGVIDTLVPKKSPYCTIFSKKGNLMLVILIVFVLIIHAIIKFLRNKLF